MEESTAAEDRTLRMQHREIMLADGRYLIFYTFDRAEPPQPTDTDEASRAKRTDV